MGKVGYTITEAASSAGVTKHDIVEAMRARELTAHRVNGNAIILATGLQAWIESQPNWFD